MSQETLERELARRADDVHGAPFSLEDVRGRAHSIQRRRRAVVAGAVAAAVALVVVVPGLLAGSPAKEDAPDPAPPVPGHTAVLHDGSVTMPDGTTAEVGVDNADVVQLGVLTDGRLVLALSKPYAVRVLRADGTLQADYPVAANVITMSARDDAVAWVADDYTVRVLSSGSAEPDTLPGIPMPGEAVGSIDAVLDPEHLLVGDHTTTTGELTPDGVTDLPRDQQFRVEDVSPDGRLLAVTFVPDVDHQYGCAGLFDTESGSIVRRSCDVHPIAFAPDGEHLLSGYFENNMAGDVTVVDLDLQPVLRFRPAGNGAAVSRAAWADSGNVLAGVANWRTSSWTFEKVGIDGGEPDVLEGPDPGENPEGYAEYVLSE